MRTLAGAVAVVALGALAAGCGSAGSGGSHATDVQGRSAPAAASTPGAPARDDAVRPLPTCAEVWKAGRVLPLSYRGCVRAGDTVPPSSRSCSSGQRLDTYGGHYYAARGARVQWVADLRHDATFRRVLSSCSG
jgi:hypothetical protein